MSSVSFAILEAKAVLLELVSLSSSSTWAESSSSSCSASLRDWWMRFASSILAASVPVPPSLERRDMRSMHWEDVSTTSREEGKRRTSRWESVREAMRWETSRIVIVVDCGVWGFWSGAF